MIDKDESKESGAPFVQYASKSMLVFAGSIIVASMALTQVGVNFRPVMDAYAASLVIKMENAQLCEPVLDTEQIILRLEALELVAHVQGGAK